MQYAEHEQVVRQSDQQHYFLSSGKHDFGSTKITKIVATRHSKYIQCFGGRGSAHAKTKKALIRN